MFKTIFFTCVSVTWLIQAGFIMALFNGWSVVPPPTQDARIEEAKTVLASSVFDAVDHTVPKHKH